MFPFTPIGVIHSCFQEKFGIPRQPGLVPAARATLELLPPYKPARGSTWAGGFFPPVADFRFPRDTGGSLATDGASTPFRRESAVRRVGHPFAFSA
jgi:hypothetical protein